MVARPSQPLLPYWPLQTWTVPAVIEHRLLLELPVTSAVSMTVDSVQSDDAVDKCGFQSAVMAEVSLLTNHAEALLCVARTPGMRIRDIAECVGITERAAQRIVGELETEGYLTRHRVGRRNFYETHPDLPASRSADPSVTLGSLLKALLPSRHDEAA